MTNTEILALLEAKFQGVRKDSLGTLAATLTMMSDEEAKKFVEGLDATRLNQFVTEDRKNRDAEISKAIATYKQKNPEPQPPVTPPAPPTDNGNNQPDLAKMIAEAVANAVNPLTTQIQNLKTERDTTARLGALNQILNAENTLPQSYKDMMIANFNATQFADETAFANYLETQKSNVAKFKQEMIDSGFANQRPTIGKTNADGISSGVALYLQNAKSDEFKGKAL